MASTINYKDAIFEQENLTSIYGKPTSKTIHEIRNELKDNVKSVYSNIGGGSHGRISLVITYAQHVINLNTPFI